MTATVRRIAIFALFILYLNGVAGLNILGIFPYQGKSHHFVFEPLLKQLASSGHNLTVISHFPQKQPLKNFHDISLAGKVEVIEDIFPIERSMWTIIQTSLFLREAGTDNCRLMLEEENVQNLWKSKSKFDVVIVEQFNSDCPLALAHVLGAPVVGVTSHMLMPFHYSRFGIQYNPAYIPFMMIGGDKDTTLYQRIQSTFFHWYFNLLYKYFMQRVDQDTIAKYFDNVPELEELGRNIKFMLLYQNSVLTGSRLLPANVKEVGGYHVAAPKPLSPDLKKFLDESKEGVIFISFGSMLKAKSIPEDKLNAILSTLTELPQRVVWKWDEKTLPGNPKNIFLSEWMPQNDILAHPNVVAFFSHSGMLSTTEAIHHGVPVVAMPIFGDQPSNAAAVESSGLGVQIHIAELTKEYLLAAFRTVLAPEFRKNVKDISSAWHDQPLTPMQSAVYWIEYAARHKNLSFRTAAADVPLYQYLYLDILAVSTAAFLGVLLLTRIIYASCFAKKQKTVTEKLKKKPKKA